MKKLIISIVAVVAVIAVIFLAVNAATGPKKYSTGIASLAEISEVVNVRGNIEGGERVTYYAAVTAPVAEYDIEVGDTVGTGDQLLSYNTTDLENAYALAQISSAQAADNMTGQVQQSNANSERYNNALANVDFYSVSYNQVREASQMLTGGQYVDNYITTASANSISQQIAYAGSVLATKQAELSRLQYMLETDINVDRNKTDHEIKELIEEIGELQRDIQLLNKNQANLPQGNLSPEEYALSLYYGNLMEDYLRKWTEAQTEVNAYSNTILTSGQQASLQDACDMALLNEAIAFNDLTVAGLGVSASSNGIVVESFVNAGSMVAKGAPLFTVEKTDEMIVDVSVSKYDIGKIELGQSAEIILGDMLYSGSVTKINRIAETASSDSAKVSVEITIDNPDDRLFLGLEAEVNILTDKQENVLSIPYEAYYTDDEGDYCYTIANGVVEKNYIETGIESGDRIQVISGLDENAVVITDAITDSMIGAKAEAK